MAKTEIPEELVPLVEHGVCPTDGERAMELLATIGSFMRELIDSRERAENRVRGLDAKISALTRDKEAEVLRDPLRPQVEAVHACWKKACKRRRGLDASDHEGIARTIKNRGLGYALKAVAGAMFDPFTRELKNGKVERYDDLELIFRNSGKVADFAGRAPKDWTPDPEKIASIAKEDVDLVREWLGLAP